jgi:hypothetical protein
VAARTTRPWSRRDGGVWERGGTWRYDELGDDSLLGLVSMGRGGPADASIDTELEVDWFRVYDLRIRGPGRSPSPDLLPV